MEYRSTFKNIKYLFYNRFFVVNFLKKIVPRRIKVILRGGPVKKFGYAGFESHHSDLIVELVKQLNCNTFLELGTYDGHTLHKVSRYVRKVISVDIKDVRKKKVGEFHLKNTDDFFDDFKEKVDIVFIDADHQFESVKKDFENSLNILNRFGMILIHDTDPMEKRLLDPGYCGDSYKINKWIREKYPHLDVMVLPITECGLTMVKRREENRANDL